MVLLILFLVVVLVRCMGYCRGCWVVSFWCMCGCLVCVIYIVCWCRCLIFLMVCGVVWWWLFFLVCEVFMGLLWWLGVGDWCVGVWLFILIRVLVVIIMIWMFVLVFRWMGCLLLRVYWYLFLLM